MASSRGATAPTVRKRRIGPRAPSRGRGVLRHRLLLDATDDLLQNESPDTVGLYQIAERAGVPPASVYHFFPTKEAAFVALAERHLHGLMQAHRQPIEAGRLQGWQDLLSIDMHRAMTFYNANPAALKILYGGYGGVDGRIIDRMTTVKLAGVGYERLNRLFHMPYMREPERTFELRMAIMDAFWTVSVRRHGRITDAYREESYAACVAYTRLVLPERLERREWLVDAAARGESITLPFD